jgi:hypothetical protein
VNDDEKLIEAARRLCEARAQNPDERVLVPNEAGHAVACFAPRWAVACEEIKDRLLVDKALEELK